MAEDAGPPEIRDEGRQGGAHRAMTRALAALGAMAVGLIAWGWLQFGDTIYLARLTAIVANCF